MFKRPRLFLPLFPLLVLGKLPRDGVEYNLSLIIDRYGLCGLLRPFTVYPTEMVYWGVSLTIVRGNDCLDSFDAEFADGLDLSKSVSLDHLSP